MSCAVVAVAAKPEMSERAFEILRCAVTIAREEQIGKVHVLKTRLQNIFPALTPDIDMALVTWANFSVKNNL